MLSASASRRAWSACTERRAERSTTEATATATSRNSASATRWSASSTLSVCSGGVKYQFSSRLPSTAATTAGHSPPTRAQATVSAR